MHFLRGWDVSQPSTCCYMSCRRLRDLFPWLKPCFLQAVQEVLCLVSATFNMNELVVWMIHFVILGNTVVLWAWWEIHPYVPWLYLKESTLISNGKYSFPLRIDNGESGTCQHCFWVDFKPKEPSLLLRAMAVLYFPLQITFVWQQMKRMLLLAISPSLQFYPKYTRHYWFF